MELWPVMAARGVRIEVATVPVVDARPGHLLRSRPVPATGRRCRSPNRRRCASRGRLSKTPLFRLVSAVVAPDAEAVRGRGGYLHDQAVAQPRPDSAPPHLDRQRKAVERSRHRDGPPRSQWGHCPAHVPGPASPPKNEVARTDFHAQLHSRPGATRRAPGSELCTVAALAQGMDHALQDPERG
jgi:hypothetical protein